MQKDRSYKDEIHRAFRRSESQLRKALKRRKAEVKVMWYVHYKRKTDFKNYIFVCNKNGFLVHPIQIWTSIIIVDNIIKILHSISR